MKKNISAENSGQCNFAGQSPLCQMLDKAGVPADEKWWSLIIYLRSLKHHHYLSSRQKAEIQAEVVRLLQDKDFSDERFRQLVERQEAILNSPYKQKLQQALEESMSLLREFGNMLKSRRGDVQELELLTVDTIQSGADPEEAVDRLRGAFRNLAGMLEEDARSLEAMAMTDSLTGLANRRSFDKYMKRVFGENSETTKGLCLLMIDVDHFKKVNDTYGHRIGDQALAMVAKHLSESLREKIDADCLAARFGGEEFTVAIPDFDLRRAMEVAEDIRNEIQNHNFVIRNAKGRILERNVTITVSIGVAETEPHWGESAPDRLVERADAALYRAKSEGRNRVCEYAPSRD